MSRILVVDDHLLICQMLKVTLTKLNYPSFDTARDGGEALSKIEQALEQKNPYSLVILDWNIPKIDGFQVLASCRKNPALKNMKIVMLTSETYQSSIDRALKEGADDYICKPFNHDHIASLLQKYL